ncbi:MAG: fatty acyl-CoA reductase [Burkholderiales bacterium]
MINEHSDISVVKQRLAGKRVLITGATGFLAKVLLEKLFREVPDIGEFVLLMRGNRDYPAGRDRFQCEVLASSIFDRLRLEEPARFDQICREKVRCVTGEVTEPYFGLTSWEFKELAFGIDIIVNAAASVNFREELDQALAINTLSLLNITRLAKAAGTIPLIHISTCYVNGFNCGEMHEEIVGPAGIAIPRNARGFYDVGPLIDELQVKITDIKDAHDGDRQGLADKLVELGIREAHRYGWNDTYTFTKWIGEQIAMRELQGGTLTILRPSIIESTLRDPVVGWIEGVKVADAIILAYARQKVTFFPGNAAGILDIIPVDMVANGIVLAMTESIVSPEQHRIYQCCSGSRNPMQLGEMIDYVTGEIKQNYTQYKKLCRRKPTRSFHAVNRTVFLIAMSCVRLAMSCLSRVSRLFGAANTQQVMEALNTTHNLAVLFSFYTSPRYRFHSENLVALSERLGETDRQLFPVDAQIIDWSHYMRKIHVPGLDRYALKNLRRAPVEPPSEPLDSPTAEADAPGAKVGVIA